MTIIILFVITIIFILRRLSIKENTLVFLILIFYVISFVSTIIYNYIWGFHYEISNVSMIYLGLILFMWFYPFHSIGDKSIQNINLVNVSLFKTIIAFFGIINSISTIYFAYYAALNWSATGLNVIRSSEYLVTLFPKNIFSNILIYSSSIFSLNLLFFFVSLRFKFHFAFSIVSFIGSFSFAALTLNFAGRDGVIYWLMIYLLNYYLFNSSLSKRLQLKLKSVLISFGSFLIVFFISISLARFYIGFGSYLDVYDSLLSYMGQQSANFSRAFEANFPTYNALFPSLGKLFGYKENVDIKNVLYIQGLVDQYNVFGFFVKALVWGYGKVGTLFISIAFLLLVKFKIRAFIKDYNIYDFSIIFLIFQVPFFGVFYYRQGVGGMEVSYIAAILLFSLIKLITLKVKI